RTALDRRRRSREPTAVLSASACPGRAAFNCGVLSANICGTRVGWQLGKMAYGVLLRCCQHDRRPVAGHVDDPGRNGRQRRFAEQHGPTHAPNPFPHGRGGILSPGPPPQALALGTPWLAIVVSAVIYGLL